MPRSIIHFLALAGLILFAPNAVAGAAEDPETLIRQGIELRKAGQDARAEGYFLRAYELAATSRAAAQLGLVELALSNYLRAQQYLTEALEGRDAWIAAYRKVLEESRARARGNLFHIEIAGAPANARATIGDLEARPLAPDATLWLEPGTPEVVKIEAPGRRPTILRVRGGAGEGRRLTINMLVIVGPGGSSDSIAGSSGSDDGAGRMSASSRALQISGAAMAVVGVAAGVLGVVWYEEGSSKLHEYQNAIASNGSIPWNPQDDDWRRIRNRGVGFMIGGAVGLVGGASLYLFGSRWRRDEKHFALVTGGDSAVLLYGAKF